MNFDFYLSKEYFDLESGVGILNSKGVSELKQAIENVSTAIIHNDSELFKKELGERTFQFRFAYYLMKELSKYFKYGKEDVGYYIDLEYNRIKYQSKSILYFKDNNLFDLVCHRRGINESGSESYPENLLHIEFKVKNHSEIDSYDIDRICRTTSNSKTVDIIGEGFVEFRWLNEIEKIKVLDFIENMNNQIIYLNKKDGKRRPIISKPSDLDAIVAGYQLGCAITFNVGDKYNPEIVGMFVENGKETIKFRIK